MSKYISLDNLQTFKTLEDAEIDGKLASKQDTLVSGTNIKTINNESLLGSGNITIAAAQNIIEADLTQLSANDGDITKIYRHTGSNSYATPGGSSENQNLITGELYTNVIYRSSGVPEKRSVWVSYKPVSLTGWGDPSGSNFDMLYTDFDEQSYDIVRGKTTNNGTTQTQAQTKLSIKAGDVSYGMYNVTLQGGSVVSGYSKTGDLSDALPYELYTSAGTTDSAGRFIPTLSNVQYFKFALSTLKNNPSGVHIKYYGGSLHYYYLPAISYYEYTNSEPYTYVMYFNGVMGLGSSYKPYYIKYTLYNDTITAVAYDYETAPITSISSSSTDTQVPSAKCVYDNLATKQNVLTSYETTIYIPTSQGTIQNCGSFSLDAGTWLVSVHGWHKGGSLETFGVMTTTPTSSNYNVGSTFADAGSIDYTGFVIGPGSRSGNQNNTYGKTLSGIITLTATTTLYIASYMPNIVQAEYAGFHVKAFKLA